MGTKKLKNDYRALHTIVPEHTVGSGDKQRTVKGPRARSAGAPSLRQYATTHPDGQEWRDRKRGGG